MFVIFVSAVVYDSLRLDTEKFVSDTKENAEKMAKDAIRARYESFIDDVFPEEELEKLFNEKTLNDIIYSINYNNNSGLEIQALYYNHD